MKAKELLELNCEYLIKMEQVSIEAVSENEKPNDNPSVSKDDSTKFYQECDFCEDAFDDKEKFEDHINSHDQGVPQTNKTFICNVCDSRFSKAHRLRLHEKITGHKPKRIQKRYPQNNRKLTGQELQTCIDVPVIYEYKNGAPPPNVNFTITVLDDDLQVPTNVLDDDEIIEQETFTDEKAIRETLAAITSKGQEWFYDECEFCEDVFASPQMLKKHISSDHSTKFTCIFCPKDYQDKCENFRQLKIHVNDAHSGLKKFECTICSKKYRKTKNLIQHRRNGHTKYFMEKANRLAS